MAAGIDVSKALLDVAIGEGPVYPFANSDPGRADDPGSRQDLREWLHDGADRAAPCWVQLDVDACFAPLLRWVLA